MDGDIQFGDLEQQEPQRQLRPDQNRHFAVVTCGAPAAGQLPVFVDLDVMRDMESHARSNTSVELGGVMLGGQFRDRDGNPFVLITDSLRAEHYEATKGSFKFTHDTWSDFTRKRQAYPEEMQMVGWYHTHPGWGVFLSGMDTYICEHFFNKPLDVALVIDPCQGDRAFFEWTLSGGVRQTRPTSGYYLIASRFRQSELETFQAQLEGSIAMPSDPRSSGYPGGYPPSVVHLTEPRQTWLSLAVLGMLLMQFAVLALIAWRLLAPPPPAPSAQLAAQAAELAAERKLLDKIIGDLQVAPEGVVQTLADQRQENEELRSVRLGLSAHISELEKSHTRLRADLQRLERSRAELLQANDDLKARRKSDRQTIADLQAELKGQEAEPATTDPTWWDWIKRWKWYLSGGIVLVLAILAAWFAAYGPPADVARQAAASSPRGPVDERDEDESRSN